MIFSDNYTAFQRYSLVSGERLSDYSFMPWLFTSLVDPQYKPYLPISIKNSLNRVLGYKYQVEDVIAIFDEEKFLCVYSIDDAIESFRSTVKYKWTIFEENIKRFKIETSTSDFPLYDKLIDVILPTLRPVTAFTGVDQDINGNITGLSIQSREYDLSSYNNPALENVARYSKIAPNWSEGILTVRNNDEVSIYSGFIYPKYISESKKESMKGSLIKSSLGIKNKKKVSYSEISQSHVVGYRANDVLTDDHIAVLDSIPFVADATTENRLQFEHIFKGTELVDVIVYVGQYHRFENLTEPRTWKIYYDSDGNELSYKNGGMVY